MLTLINILIIFFLFLIIYQLFLANRIVEGLNNDENDPLILSKENAANINVLTSRVDKLDNVNKDISDLRTDFNNLQSQVNDLSENVKELGQNQPGTKPLDEQDDTEQQ
jgi:TolA-binding protein